MMSRQISRVCALLGGAAISAGVLCMGAAALAADAKESGKPKAFPKIDLPRGVNPVYAALAMDSWTGVTAYVALEGGLSNGYPRIFVWIPEDAKYRTPVELKISSENAFLPFERKGSTASEKSDVRWRLGQIKRGRGAGSDTYLDYATGQTKTRTWTAWSGFIPTFSVDFAHGDKADMESMTKGLPLDITISGDLPTYETWDKVPEKGWQPWVNVGIHLAHSVAPGSDPSQGRFMLKYTGVYTPHGSCAVRSMPFDQALTFMVWPYMENPVYSNEVTMADIAKNGLAIDLPYGWYQFRISGMRCGKYRYGIGIPSLGNYSPYPISRSGQ